MKKSLLIFAAAAMLGISGCVNPGNIVAYKTTVLGFDVSYDSASTSPHVRLGLVRSFYQQIPVSTNKVYAPDYATRMDATLAATKQFGEEGFGSGNGVVAAILVGQGTNSVGTNIPPAATVLKSLPQGAK